MECQLSQPVPPKVTFQRKSGLFWLLPLLGLVGCQGWLILALFGGELGWERLLDDQPILSGRHPLHLYHGYLGARALLERGTLCCYDPTFQAGYPKTPVFDSGSRPAELFLLLSGGHYRPAAYKVGLALCCLLVPILLIMAARGMGLSWPATLCATSLGLLVWWGSPCQEALEAGELDLLLAGVAALGQFGFLVLFDRRPTLRAWLGAGLCSYLGWFAHLHFFALLLPLTLIYYLSVGTRHKVGWHLALFGVLGLTLAVHAFWVEDWIVYWWIRSPLQAGSMLLPHRTFQTIWNAPLWGDSGDRVFTLALLLIGGLGVIILNQTRKRAAARLLGLGALALLLLALAGVAWEPAGMLGTSRLLPSALLFAAVPAGHAMSEVTRQLGRWSGGPSRGVIIVIVLLAAGAAAGHEYVMVIAGHFTKITPLTIGLGPDRQELLGHIRTHTTSAARILWEDRRKPQQGSYWTALLPLLLGDSKGGLATEAPRRAYLGGLDPWDSIDHATAGFTDQILAGRHISQWSDEDLEGFCRRYNIGWVVCWSPPAQARFRAWSAAKAVVSLRDESTGCLFALHRKTAPSFFLKGKGRWLHAGCDCIVLEDVVPENGEVVLSLHYQAGMRTSPRRIQIEREEDPHDPIPFVRLRLPEPTTRITLTWHSH